METTEKKGGTRCVLSITAAIILIFGALVLMGYYLNIVPEMQGITLGQLFLYGATIMAPLLAGGIWLGAMAKRGNQRSDANRSRTGGLLLGMILVIAGLFLLSFGIGLIPAGWKSAFVSWQMLLIVIGIIEICKHHFVWGITVAGLGSFFFIPRLIKSYPASWDIDGSFLSVYWPALLVILGVVIILGVIIRPRREPGRCGHNKHERIKMEADSKEGVIDYSLLFTGAEHVFLEPVFRGGQISTVCAGMELDLRRAELPEGTTYLKISTVMGGVEIKVPEDWYIEIKNESVLGGLSDKRYNRGESNPDRKLVIIASCVLGGAELGN